MRTETIRDFLYLFTPWWGKIFCAIFGALLFGSAGVVFGLVVGNFFDKGLFNNLYSPQWHPYRQESPEIKNLYIAVLFKVMGNVAKADGQISKADISTARVIMKEMRLYGFRKRKAMQYYNQGKRPDFKLEAALSLTNNLCRHNPGLLKLFAHVVYRTAHTEGISIGKQQRLNIIFTRLGFKPIYGKQQHHHHSRQSNKQYPYSRPEIEEVDDYALLGISPLSKRAEVKRAYRKKISKIHPDKLIAQGASKEEIQAATILTQQLQAAYQRVKSNLRD